MCSHKNYDPQDHKSQKDKKRGAFLLTSNYKPGRETTNNTHLLLVSFVQSALLLTQMEAKIETITNFLIAYNFATTNAANINFVQLIHHHPKRDDFEGDDNFKAVKRGKHEKSQIAVESALQKLARQTSWLWFRKKLH